MRKPWIETTHGLGCSKYGYVPCAGNPWIACTCAIHGLRNHTCVKRSAVKSSCMFDRKTAAFAGGLHHKIVCAKEEETEQGDQSRERKSGVAYLSAGEDNGDPLNHSGMQCFR